MALSKNDLDELKRVATNMYDEDKRLMSRVIAEMGVMQREISTLKAQVHKMETEHNPH